MSWPHVLGGPVGSTRDVRLEAHSETVREAYPEAYTDLMVFITDLGGADYLVVILAVLFWVTRRHDTALVVAYTIAGASLMLALKATLGWERPPEDVWVIEYEADPYGFPSGHALIATVVYGGLLYRFGLARHWGALAGVVTLIGLVSISRVVLGLHYLGDLLFGAALGIAVLVALELLVRENLRVGFGVALVAAAVGSVVAGPSIETAWILLGFAVGGVAVGHRVESLPPLRSRVEAAVLTVVGLALVALGVALEGAVTSVGVRAVEIGLMVGLYAVLFVAILLLPAAIGHVEHPRLEGSEETAETGTY